MPIKLSKRLMNHSTDEVRTGDGGGEEMGGGGKLSTCLMNRSTGEVCVHVRVCVCVCGGGVSNYPPA